MPATGGCLCKAVRYRIDAEPIVVRECWCRVCQYLGGGSSAVNVCFPSSKVQLTGTLTQYDSRADSGNLMHRSFCPACGTPVLSAAASRPHLVFVRAGTLDDPDVARPQVAIWTASAPRWACIDPKLPQVPGQPPPAA